jgi:heme-degrading monooxygenase HmoA
MSVNDVVVLGHSRFIEIDLVRLAAVRQRVLNVVKDIPGFVSATLWEQHDDPFAFLTVSHYLDEADSVRAFDSLIRSPVIDVVNELLSEAPDILRFRVLKKTGRPIEQLKVGDFMSLSKRIADPGMATDLLAELQGIFAELAFIPGFLGSLTGQLTEVDEEVLGLVYWESKAAWEKSMPENAMYKIMLYQRVL